MALFAIIVLSILFLGLVLSVSYNSFVHRKNTVHYAYHSLEAMIRKRHDLLPKLAEVVRASALFEGQLVQETNKLLAYQEVKNLPAPQLARKENELVQSITQITRELRNDAATRQSKSFLHLQKSIVEVEEQISAARRAYNAAAMEYNNSLEMFPTVVFASLLNAKSVDPLEELIVVDAEYTEEK